MSALRDENCVQSVFHFHRNLGFTQFDSVFIYGWPYGPPCLSSSLSTVHTDCLQLSPASKLIAARSNLKSEAQRAGAADAATDYSLAEATADKKGVDCHRVPFERFSAEASQVF